MLNYNRIDLRLDRTGSYDLSWNYGNLTPGGNCTGWRETGEWTEGSAETELALVRYQRQDLCEPGVEEESTYGRTTIPFRDIGTTGFSLCFGNCDRETNWLPFDREPSCSAFAAW
jgi:hypothetical protein